ncbi:MAG: hypothetical protein V2I66_02160 [Halieaceae bacterium]|jgi:hypothetical protein|nr:hypothetical protein [Halieaceae bacterium]
MDEPAPPNQGVIDELRRRKVLRSTTIYAVSGWCLLQWSDFIFGRLGWPEWTVTLVLTAVVLGFPITVALAWVFDITPRGVRLSDPNQLSAGVRTTISWIVDAVVAVLFLATLGMLYFELG